MKLRATSERLSRLVNRLARGFFAFLPLFLLFQLAGQPDLDDQNPALGPRFLHGKVFKPQQLASQGPCQGFDSCVAAGTDFFSPEFYLFVRLPGSLDRLRDSVLSLRSGRSPPLFAALWIFPRAPIRGRSVN